MNRTVFKEKICFYCINKQQCNHINEIIHNKENNLEIMKCNFYEKNKNILTSK